MERIELHIEELNDLYCSSNIFRVIKSRRLRWAGSVSPVGERRSVYRWRNLRERDHLEHPGVDGRIILRRIFTKWDVGVWNGSICLMIGTRGGLL